MEEVIVNITEVVDNVNIEVTEVAEDISITVSEAIKGDKGNDGADSTVPGPQGEKGDQGERGLQGERGMKGDTGLKGDKGDTGSTGLQGLQGSKGDTGLTGAKGDQGIQGLKGDTGERGLQGLQGDRGLQGEKGDPFTYSDFTPEQIAALTGEDAEITPELMAEIAALVDIPSNLSELSDDETHRLVTDTEKTSWDGKQPAGSYLLASDITGKVDKVAGKDLSKNDLTDELKTAYDGAVTHAGTSHAPANAQKNSDITTSEIAAKLPVIVQNCNIINADFLVAAGYSIIISYMLEIADGFTLEAGDGAIIEIT